jgi:hypothetical protein
MSEINKIYIGDVQDLELLFNEDVIAFTFAVTNADTTAYNFTGFTDVNLEVFDCDTKSKLLETLVKTDNLTIPTPANGLVLLSVDYSVDIDIDPGLYYYKLTYLDASSRPITVSLGEFNIIR